MSAMGTTMNNYDDHDAHWIHHLSLNLGVVNFFSGVVNLERMFETPERIFVVMEKLKGGTSFVNLSLFECVCFMSGLVNLGECICLSVCIIHTKTPSPPRTLVQVQNYAEKS